MADNKGSSSNPAKGLVAHLDQNRSLQQDRIVGSSSAAPAGAVSFLGHLSLTLSDVEDHKLTALQQSFRSRPSNPNAVALDTAFTEFSIHATGTQLGPIPMGPGNSINTVPGAPPFRNSANTAWAGEFLQHYSQPGVDHRVLAAHPREGHQFHHPTSGTFEVDQMNPEATALARPFPMKAIPTSHAQREIDLDMVARRNHALGLARVLPLAERYTMYPADRINDDVRLADNTEQAMEAAFAAYDQEFQGAMDDWMEANGPEGHETHVQNIQKMEDLKLEDPLASGTWLDTDGLKPDGSTKAVYDSAMMKHAGDIVATLTSNGSAETRAKMSGSSFQGLMRAVASGKAAVVDANFIDTSTGEVIHDLVALSGVNSNQESNDIGNGLPTMDGNNGDAADNTGSKGKDKMKSLEEQEQEQRKGPA